MIPKETLPSTYRHVSSMLPTFEDGYQPRMKTLLQNKENSVLHSSTIHACHAQSSTTHTLSLKVTGIHGREPPHEHTV